MPADANFKDTTKRYYYLCWSDLVETVPKSSNAPRNKKCHFKNNNCILQRFINFDRRLRLEALLSDFKGAKN